MFSKTANVFKLPRAFAPVLQMFSRKLLRKKNIFGNFLKTNIFAKIIDENKKQECH